jgi:hypothetical protein
MQHQSNRCLDWPRRFVRRRDQHTLFRFPPAESPHQGDGAHVNALEPGDHLHVAFEVLHFTPRVRKLFEIAGRNIRAYQMIPQNPLNLTKLQKRL